MQMTTVVAMITQHPDLKLFTVMLPWWRCLLPFSCHRRQLAWQFLLPPPNTTSHPSLQWVHLQWAADPCSRQPSRRDRTRAQREPSFHPWRLSRSAYKVLHWADDKCTNMLNKTMPVLNSLCKVLQLISMPIDSQQMPGCVWVWWGELRWAPPLTASL